VTSLLDLLSFYHRTERSLASLNKQVRREFDDATVTRSPLKLQQNSMTKPEPRHHLDISERRDPTGMISISELLLAGVSADLKSAPALRFSDHFNCTSQLNLSKAVNVQE
jgi:hypothetical protein